MSEQSRPNMSEAEREVLKVLWERGPLGVKEVFASLLESGQEWTRSTVVTLLGRLESKGYVASDRSRYAFVYRPTVTPEDEIHARMSELATELTDGEPVPLMLAFAERHRFSNEELARLQEMLNQLNNRSKSKRSP